MLKRWMFAGVMIVLLPSAGMAASAVVTGAGPRMGFSVDPDQLVLGGQLVIGEIAPKVTFDPNLDLGFGDNLTVIAVGFDFHYHFSLRNSDWRPYLGAGAGVHFTDVDRSPPRSDDSYTDVGGNIIIGTGIPTRGGNRFFTEMKLGLGDIPSLKLLAGWDFRL